MIRRIPRAGKSDDQAPRGSTADVALEMLARRPLTRRELISRLRDRGHPSSEIDATIEQFGVSGYLDDRSLAVDFLVTRAERLGQGPTRLIRALERRGIERGVALTAWEQAVSAGDIDPDALLRQRAHKEIGKRGGPLDARGYRRVYNALLRAGFEYEQIEARLARYRSASPRTDDLEP